MARRNDIHTEDRHRISRILWFLYCIFLLAAAAIVGKIIYLQYFWEPDSRTISEFLPNNYKSTVKPERGDIIDRNGKLLATSTPLYTIHMDCQILKKDMAGGKIKIWNRKDSLGEADWRKMAREMCQELPAILNEGRSAESYYDSIIVNRDSRKKKGRRNMLLAKDIDHSTLERLRQLPLFRESKHISGMKESKADARKYPYEELAARVIGDIRIDHKDPERNRFIGIEGEYDYILHGKEGYRWMKETDKGTVLDPDSTVVMVEHGADIRTTLDIDIQDIADRSLRKMIEPDEEIEGGCVVVMDVKTGAVRAMVNLQRDSKGRLAENFNMAIGRSGEPGSVFKTASLMTLLEDGRTTLSHTMPTNGGKLHDFPKINPCQETLRYERKTGKKTITVGDGLRVSSNYVFQRLVADNYLDCPDKFISRLYEYNLHDAYRFDLEEKGGTLPGLPKVDPKMSKYGLLVSAIGYNVKETPLNIVAFYNAIANGGKMMKPYLIEAFEKEGKVVKEFGPVILNGSICSKATADSLTKALTMVTLEGTGARLKNAKCVVAGKTGTARVYQEDIKGYETSDGKRKYQATFVGFFPAEEPLYTAIVCVYTKLRNTSVGGGSLPAMAYKEIVDDIWALDTQWGKRLEKRSDIPDMKAQYIGTRKGLAPVPDVTGMGLKDAIYALENNGYRCEYEGIGHVVRQSHKPGEKYAKGEKIRLTLE